MVELGLWTPWTVSGKVSVSENSGPPPTHTHTLWEAGLLGHTEHRHIYKIPPFPWSFSFYIKAVGKCLHPFRISDPECSPDVVSTAIFSQNWAGGFPGFPLKCGSNAHLLYSSPGVRELCLKVRNQGPRLSLAWGDETHIFHLPWGCPLHQGCMLCWGRGTVQTSHWSCVIGQANIQESEGEHSSSDTQPGVGRPGFLSMLPGSLLVLYTMHVNVKCINRLEAGDWKLSLSPPSWLSSSYGYRILLWCSLFLAPWILPTSPRWHNSHRRGGRSPHPNLDPNL